MLNILYHIEMFKTDSKLPYPENSLCEDVNGGNSER